MHNHAGEIIGTQGFYIDVTPPGPAQREAISAAVAEFADNRALVEQVKGVLMFVYKIDADAAFDLLKWRSQETNVKLRTLTEQLQADIRSLRYDDNLPHRSEFDRLLLTAHQRVSQSSNAADVTAGSPHPNQPRSDARPMHFRRTGLVHVPAVSRT